MLYQADGWALAKQMVAWRAALRDRWKTVRAELGDLPGETVTVGDPVRVEAKVWLNGLPPTDIAVELVTGEQGNDGELRHPTALPMSQVGKDGDALIYATDLTPARSGPLAVAARVRPDRQNQIHPIEPGLLIRWALVS
jgi:starch phosphorylase